MARIRGKGAAVYVSDAENGTVFTKIGRVSETDLFGINNGAEEVSTLEDEADQFEPTSTSYDDMSFEIILDDADVTHDNATGLMALARTRAKRTWRFVASNGKKFEYKMFVQSLKWTKATKNNILRGQLALKHYTDPVAINAAV